MRPRPRSGPGRGGQSTPAGQARGDALDLQRPDPRRIVRREGHLSPAAERTLSDAVDRVALSGRGFDRVLRVARTVADLAGSVVVDAEHVAEALAFRAAAVDDGDSGRMIEPATPAASPGPNDLRRVRPAPVTDAAPRWPEGFAAGPDDRDALLVLLGLDSWTPRPTAARAVT